MQPRGRAIHSFDFAYCTKKLDEHPAFQSYVLALSTLPIREVLIDGHRDFSARQRLFG